MIVLQVEGKRNTNHAQLFNSHVSRIAISPLIDRVLHLPFGLFGGV